MLTKQCGNCKHWDNPFTTDYGDRQGWCGAPVPESISDRFKMPMIEDEGTDCEVFVEKKDTK